MIIEFVITFVCLNKGVQSVDKSKLLVDSYEAVRQVKELAIKNNPKCDISIDITKIDENANEN